MKKISLAVLTCLVMGLISCRDTKKEEQNLDTTLDKIEAVEQDIDKTSEELEQKAEEVKSALNELDSL